MHPDGSTAAATGDQHGVTTAPAHVRGARGARQHGHRQGSIAETRYSNAGRNDGVGASCSIARVSKNSSSADATRQPKHRVADHGCSVRVFARRPYAPITPGSTPSRSANRATAPVAPTPHPPQSAPAPAPRRRATSQQGVHLFIGAHRDPPPRNSPDAPSERASSQRRDAARNAHTSHEAHPQNPSSGSFLHRLQDRHALHVVRHREQVDRGPGIPTPAAGGQASRRH